MAYRTTRPVIVLSIGLTRGVHQPLAAGELPEGLFERMVADGTVIEVPDPAPPPPAIDATEAAVKLAGELGIDLADVSGSGEGGRILVSDVREHGDD